MGKESKRESDEDKMKKPHEITTKIIKKPKRFHEITTQVIKRQTTNLPSSNTALEKHMKYKGFEKRSH